MVTYPNAYLIAPTSYVASSKYKMKCIKIQISLFLSFFLGTHIWVFFASHSLFFQFSVAHPLNTALLPRSPFWVFNLARLFSFQAYFFFFPFSMIALGCPYSKRTSPYAGWNNHSCYWHWWLRTRSPQGTHSYDSIQVW